jgi:hypothetical protein
MLVRALLLVLFGACVVTRPPELAERPRWRLTAPATYAASCAQADAFIRKSGKTGVGVSLRVRSTETCTFTIAASRIVFGKRVVPAGAVGPLALPGRSQLYAWLPVKFDNDAVWNDDRNDATIELDVVVAAQPAVTWKIPVHQQ